MKRQILLLAITAAALSSCTTAYKTGQTPDDVYFSPTRPQDEYVRTEEKEQPRYDENYYDDRYLRMKVHNRTQWDNLDDWYSYERYGYSVNRYYGSYYNPYTSWNYYYNPYCRNNVIAYYPGQTGYPGKINVVQNVPKPRSFNLASYTNTNFNNTNSNFKTNSYKSGRPVYSNRNLNDGFSNTLKQIFNSGNSNSSYSPPSRSYSPGSSSSGSGGSSGSSGGSSSGSSSGGASRPSRGGN